MSVEAAELLEHYLWSEEPRAHDGVKEEVADVLYLLLLFCAEAGIDPGQALLDKLATNESKYPADKVRGSAKKYSDYE